MGSMRRILLLTLVAAVPGCALFGDRFERKLDREREQWIALGIKEYNVSFVRGCFCTLESTQPVTIYVKADTITGVYSRTGVDVTSQGDWPTITELFDKIADLHSKGWKVTVRYHPVLHYPTNISGDLPGTIDDEFTETLGDLSTPVVKH
jgi:hypothetical protein